MTKRIERVNSLLEQEIAKIIEKDFDFHGAVVTVMRIETSLNLIQTKVYISVFPDENLDKIIELLNRNVYSIQKQINKMVKMRPVPKIIFVKDENPTKAARIEKLLEELKKEEK